MIYISKPGNLKQKQDVACKLSHYKATDNIFNLLKEYLVGLQIYMFSYVTKFLQAGFGFEEYIIF